MQDRIERMFSVSIFRFETSDLVIAPVFNICLGYFLIYFGGAWVFHFVNIPTQLTGWHVHVFLLGGVAGVRPSTEVPVPECGVAAAYVPELVPPPEGSI